MKNWLAMFLVLGFLAPPAGAGDWATYWSADRGCKVSYPADLFSEDDLDNEGAETARFLGPDRKTFFRIIEADNAEELSLPQLKNKYFGPSIPGDVTYRRTTDDFLVFSGYRRERVFYARVELSVDNRTMCIFEITYPRELKREFDRLVTRMSHSLSAN